MKPLISVQLLFINTDGFLMPSIRRDYNERGDTFYIWTWFILHKIKQIEQCRRAQFISCVFNLFLFLLLSHLLLISLKASLKKFILYEYDLNVENLAWLEMLSCTIDTRLINVDQLNITLVTVWFLYSCIFENSFWNTALIILTYKTGLILDYKLM